MKFRLKHMALLGIASIIFNSCSKDEGNILLSSSKEITQFTVPGLSGNIADHTITLTVPYKTDTYLAPTVVHTGASIEPASGGAIDFANPVTYTVTAADGSKNIYTVTANFYKGAPGPISTSIANVKDAPYNAKGDGITDDTYAIQQAINAIALTEGTVFIPAGTYMIDASKSVVLKSNMTLRLETGAVLKAIPNPLSNYVILSAKDISHVNIIGGTLQGDLGAHLGTTGQWGHGLSFSNSHNAVVEGVTAKDCWGDGFYVGRSSSNITFFNVKADNNRRQGMSVTDASGLTILNSTFMNTNGLILNGELVCGIGIDIEPNKGETVNNVFIFGCTFKDNKGAGFAGGPANVNMANSFVRSVTLDGNVFSGNLGDGLIFSSCDSNTVKNNNIENNTGYGIYFYGSASKMLVSGNTVKGSTLHGIIAYQCPALGSITGNTVSANSKNGIYLHTSIATLSGNTGTGNGDYGIQLVKATGSALSDNTVQGIKGDLHVTP